MAKTVWTILATDGVRSLAEVSNTGEIWVRDGLTIEEHRSTLYQVLLILAAKYSTVYEVLSDAIHSS